MGTVIVLANHKKGVGKSTMSMVLLETLAKRYGYKVLGIDMDPQSNLSEALLGAPFDLERTSYWLQDPPMTPFYISPSWHAGVKIIPSSLAFEEIVYSLEKNALKKALEKVKDNYDFIIIDTPSNLGPLVKIAFHAADIFVVPCSSRKHSAFSIPGILHVFKEEFKNVPEEDRPTLLGTLITIYDSRVSLEKMVSDYLYETSTVIGKIPKVQQIANNIADKKTVLYKTSRAQQEPFLTFVDLIVKEAQKNQDKTDIMVEDRT